MSDAPEPVYAVIGDPIGHSLSPLMQNWFLRTFGLPGTYVAFQVSRRELPQAVEGIRALGIRGVNVTVPHKEAVLPLVDEGDEEVRRLGAANTLENANGRLIAHVTDPYGFIASLGEERDRLRGAQVMLFGAGGAARSVCRALAQLGAARVIIHDVDGAKCSALAELCASFGLPAVILSSLKVDLNQVIAEAAVVINATPVGMPPLQERTVLEDMRAVGKGHFFYDLVYNPPLTRFLREAAQKGAEVRNGLDMLIFQGLQSLRLWTGLSLELSGDQLREVRTLLQRKLHHE